MYENRGEMRGEGGEDKGGGQMKSRGIRPKCNYVEIILCKRLTKKGKIIDRMENCFIKKNPDPPSTPHSPGINGFLNIRFIYEKKRERIN